MSDNGPSFNVNSYKIDGDIGFMIRFLANPKGEGCIAVYADDR